MGKQCHLALYNINAPGEAVEQQAKGPDFMCLAVASAGLGNVGNMSPGLGLGIVPLMSAARGCTCVSRLDISDHGSDDGSIWVGDHKLTSADVAKFCDSLCPNATVTLLGACHAGETVPRGTPCIELGTGMACPESGTRENTAVVTLLEGCPKIASVVACNGCVHMPFGGAIAERGRTPNCCDVDYEKFTLPRCDNGWREFYSTPRG